MTKYYSSPPVTQEERETIATYDDINDTWSIYTNVRKHITKLLKIFTEEECTSIGKDSNGRIVEISIDGATHSQVSFRNKPKPMSEEQKAAMADRLQKARENKSS